MKKRSKDPAFKLKSESFLPKEELRHRYGPKKRIICVTESKGFPVPVDRDLREIRVGLGRSIPLWEKGVTLKWRFDKSFDSFFDNPKAAMVGIRKLLKQSIADWGTACPVKFKEVETGWDFQVAMHPRDCDSSGCVLASAFFPGTAQDTLHIYPTMLEQDKAEQVATLQHEIGHIFGLRHFFANISEKDMPSQLFGSDKDVSIMNYGEESQLTPTDLKDLRKLYKLVWGGKLKQINGTAIKTFPSYQMKAKR